MKLSQGVEWGLHRAMLPAQAPEGGLTRRDPPAPPAEHITVLDIVEAIEGTAPPFLRQEIRRRGTGASTPEERLRPCPVNSVTREAHSALAGLSALGPDRRTRQPPAEVGARAERTTARG
ncbi:hypothetical protein, partial [Streptomyces rubradiris]|uniref:hypothetical protein n=1 Tax=Streptomyces rubradiris TaxID=285531 RepID=UPI001940A40D